MKTNFEIDDNYALLFNDKHIDLHNNFDFKSYQFYKDTNSLILTWTKSIGQWVSKYEYATLTMIHFNVTYLNINNKDLDVNLITDNCLGEITFSPSIDRDINNAFTIQKTPQESDDILYVFTNEEFIRVGCNTVQLICE